MLDFIIIYVEVLLKPLQYVFEMFQTGLLWLKVGVYPKFDYITFLMKVNFIDYILNWESVTFVWKEYSGIFRLYYWQTLPTNLTFVYAIKFTFSILILIFLRAGLPRYRYDYLTKLGWSKFVLFCLALLLVFILTLMVI